MLLLRVRENICNSSSSSAVWGLGCIGVRHTAFIDDAYQVPGTEYVFSGFQKQVYRQETPLYLSGTPASAF